MGIVDREMVMTLEALKEMLANGSFHHATVKMGRGRCWDGLYIYEKATEAEGGFRGFKLTGSFSAGWDNYPNDPIFVAAQDLVHGTGVSFGSYGQG